MKKKTIGIIITGIIIAAGGGFVYANSKEETPKQEKAINEEAKKELKEEKITDEENKSSVKEGTYSKPTYKELEVEGIKIDIPTFLKEDKKNSFVSENKQVQLAVDSIKGDNLKTYYNSKIKEVSKTSYKYLGENTYSLSWSDDNLEYYQSGINNNNKLIVFTMAYPKEDKKDLEAVVTKVYDSFIKNKTENKEEFTYDNGAAILKKYLTDIGYSFKEKIEDDTKYTFGLEKATDNPNISEEYINKDNPETVKNMKEINSEKYKYKINYMNYVENLKKEQAHASRIAMFYVTPNGIYLESVVTMDIVKVANIKDGQVQIIGGKSIIEKG